VSVFGAAVAQQRRVSGIGILRRGSVSLLGCLVPRLTDADLKNWLPNYRLSEGPTTTTPKKKREWIRNRLHQRDLYDALKKAMDVAATSCPHLDRRVKWLALV